MDWTDDAYVLNLRPFAEGGALVSLLTRERGLHRGLLRGVRKNAVLAGAPVQASWRARLAEHLGTLSLEPAGEAVAARLFDDGARLMALQSACAVAAEALPEREPHPAIYDGFAAFLAALDGPHWAAVYVRWEMGVLADLGFGIDLSRCAATGQAPGEGNDQLAYVSPRTGRAVSLSAGEPWRDKLLPLPGFLIGRGEDSPDEVAKGLALTGFFLERHALGAAHKPMPEARGRLVAAIAAQG